MVVRNFRSASAVLAWSSTRMMRYGSRPMDDSSKLSLCQQVVHLACGSIDVSEAQFSNFRSQESRQLQLEKSAQTTEKSGAIFALFGRLILGQMSVFYDALGLHFSLCQQFAQSIETLRRLANDFAHDWFADFQNVAVGRGADGGGAAFAGQE